MDILSYCLFHNSLLLYFQAMEVSGKKPSRYQTLASDQCNPVNCQPCGETGKQIRAKAHCNDCLEYICKQCCDYHKQMKVFFLAFDFCRFCVVIRFFHPRHNGQ